MSRFVLVLWSRNQVIRNIDGFAKALGDLLAYYHKPVNTTVRDRWYKRCNEELTDEEFIECVGVCLDEKVYLPPINEFIQLVRGDVSALGGVAALSAWKAIEIELGRASSPEYREAREALVEKLSPAQKAALDQLGGIWRLSQVLEKDLEWKRKDFLKLVETFEQGAIAKDRAERYLSGTGGAERYLSGRNNGGGLTVLGDALF